MLLSRRALGTLIRFGRIMPSFLHICSCGAKRYFKDADVGKQEWCVACSTFFVVRDPSRSEPTAIDGNPGNRKSQSAETHGDSNLSDTVDTSRIRYICGECGKKTDYPLSFAGTARHCLACKAPFIVPEAPAKEELSVSAPVEERERIGRYELREYLGEGGMGVLRIAWDTQLRRTVALKQIHPKFAERKRSSAQRRMVREAVLTAGLSHPNIIPIYTLEYDDREEPFYTMPVLEGTSLKFKITKYHETRSDKDRLHTLLRHFTAVCRAVGYAHSRRIVHRDIKPANIHFDGFGNPVLIDWGLARQVSVDIESLLTPKREEPEPEILRESEEEFGYDLTLDGQLVGTRRYWAPEYRRTRVSTPSNDVYALGLVLYSILCGTHPYTVEEINAGAQHELPSGAKHPSRMNLLVDANLANICLKCLYYDPEKRMPDAKSLAQAIDHCLDK